MTSPFWKGVRHGIPIALGYLSVSFGFGIQMIQKGFDIWIAAVISLTNLTSAGQLAGLTVMAAGGTYLEMALTQLVVNLRYSLMGISLSQKLDKTFTTPRRCLAAFGITDEIFAVASSQEGKLTARYLYGMILTAFLGWVAGTLFGAAAGQLLPAEVTSAMGLALYGMFLAIMIPPCRKSRGVLAVVVIAALCSILFRYVLTFVSSGFAIIICTVAAAAVGALLFPVKEEQT